MDSKNLFKDMDYAIETMQGNIKKLKNNEVKDVEFLKIYAINTSERVIELAELIKEEISKIVKK